MRVRTAAATCVVAACAAASSADDAAPPPFGFADVVEQARRLAASPYAEAPEHPLPDAMSALSYDGWRRIVLRPDALDRAWPGTRFRVRLFPRGHLFVHAVDVRLVEDGRDRRLPFTADLFDFPGGVSLAGAAEDLGFGGAGLDFETRPGAPPEQVLHFLGASYFRVKGLADAGYGVSARGIGVGTGSTSEEFPRFRALWFVRPATDADAATAFALLDGPSVAGAYRFVARPGAETRVEVEARLFPRTAGARLSLAPLTSMFLHGENEPPRRPDFRPEVHDSDGLSLEDGDGERLWRPLTNPAAPTLGVYRMQSPRGFGLMQRDRDFDHYQDVEAAYHQRPGAWVAPRGDWGAGAVELLELPTDVETSDNVVASWRPDAPVAAGAELRFEYELRFGETQENGGRALATRRAARPDGATRFFIDFAGGALDAVDPKDVPDVVVTTKGGQLVGDAVAQYVPFTRAWRVFFDVRPDGKSPVELRAFLRRGKDALTETWTTPWIP